MGLAPPLTQGSVEAGPELQRQLIRLALLVQSNGLADVIDNYLARVAPGHVLLQLLAD